MTRKNFITSLAYTFFTFLTSKSNASSTDKPLLSRIKIATIGAQNIDEVEHCYTKWLGYSVVEKSIVGKNISRSWGTPNTEGRPFILLQPASNENVYIRAVEIDNVTDYKPMTTLGWNAIEIICEDVDRMHNKLKNSPFRHIGGPANLSGNNSSIRAAQYIGPGKEVLYLTCETGDRIKSPLPLPGAEVGRPFIMILAGKNIDEMELFYRNVFRMGQGSYRFPYKGGLISKMQNRSMDKVYNLGLIRLREKGNSIELDEYPEDIKPRKIIDGQLPPGIAMTTFNVDNLDSVAVEFISDYVIEYDGKRSAVFIGPNGELTELIEDDRSQGSS